MSELEKRSVAIEDSVKHLINKVDELSKRLDMVQASLNDVKVLLSELLIELKTAINDNGGRIEAKLNHMIDLLIKLLETCRS